MLRVCLMCLSVLSLEKALCVIKSTRLLSIFEYSFNLPSFPLLLSLTFLPCLSNGTILILGFCLFLLHVAGRVGCPHYIAPEVITRRQYGKSCDVWGAGVMLHVLLSGRLPFNGSGRRLQEAIARGRITVS